MKNVLIIAFCFSLFYSCNLIDLPESNKGSHVRDENYETIANKITKQVALKLSEEKGLRCAGIGGGMMSNIRMMGLSLDLFQEVNLSEARQLLVYATTTYLKAINSSKEIRPYLRNYPFKISDIEVIIFVRKADNHDVSPGNIVCMSSINAILRYDLLCKPGAHVNAELCRETYEEALKILQEETTIDQPTDS